MRNKQNEAAWQAIDGQQLAQIFRQFAALLSQNEQLLNDLNVFPVPDSDTGTNSLLTVQAGLIHIDKGKKDCAVVSAHLAADAGANARGNSGVILAEYVRGFAKVATHDLDVAALHACLSNAAAFAQTAVAVPRAGTMLSIAQAVTDVDCADDLGSYVTALSQTARRSVHDSTTQLDELRAAGVVDAGALALSLLFDAMDEVINNKKLAAIELVQTSCDVEAINYRGPDYEVMFNFTGDAQSLREELVVMGESLTVTGPAANARFHIHVDNPTETILEAMRHGMASRIVIHNLRATPEVDVSLANGIGVVIALEGSGLVDQVSEVAAQCVNLASDPSIGEFEAAIRNTKQRNVIVLPSALDNHAASTIAAHNLRAESISVRVLPTRTVPQSLAALAVFDADKDLKSNLQAMSRAADTTRSGCVLVNDSGVIEGYIDGVLFESSPTTSANDMLTHVVDNLLSDGGELVTIIVGESGQAAHVHLMADHVGVEFEYIDGGQATSTYLVGVE